MLSLPTWLRAACITAAQAFVASFLVLLLGLIGDVQEWVDSGVTPDWSVWAKALAWPSSLQRPASSPPSTAPSARPRTPTRNRRGRDPSRRLAVPGDRRPPRPRR